MVESVVNSGVTKEDLAGSLFSVEVNLSGFTLIQVFQVEIARLQYISVETVALVGNGNI